MLKMGWYERIFHENYFDIYGTVVCDDTDIYKDIYINAKVGDRIQLLEHRNDYTFVVNFRNVKIKFGGIGEKCWNNFFKYVDEEEEML